MKNDGKGEMGGERRVGKEIEGKGWGKDKRGKGRGGEGGDGKGTGVTTPIASAPRFASVLIRCEQDDLLWNGCQDICPSMLMSFALHHTVKF